MTDEALRNLNAEILRAFLKLASENGSRVISVYFPSKPDFESAAPRVAKEVLQERNIPYVNMMAVWFFFMILMHTRPTTLSIIERPNGPPRPNIKSRPISIMLNFLG